MKYNFKFQIICEFSKFKYHLTKKKLYNMFAYEKKQIVILKFKQ